MYILYLFSFNLLLSLLTKYAAYEVCIIYLFSYKKSFFYMFNFFSVLVSVRVFYK